MVFGANQDLKARWVCAFLAVIVTGCGAKGAPEAQETPGEVQTFDRETAQAQADEDLANQRKATKEACGSVPAVTVKWSTVSDEMLKGYSVAGYCGNILSALRDLCQWDPGKRFVERQIQRIECAWSDDDGFAFEGGTMAWIVTADAADLEEKAKEALLREKTSENMTLAQAITYAQTDVCMSADESHVVVVHPHQPDSTLGISYGTSEVLHHTPQAKGLSRGWFFDPRQFREGNNSNFRGHDLRYYSRVEVDRDENKCRLTCGDRDTTWTLLPAERARGILANAETQPASFAREPYALVRDRRGNYYYVDRGNNEETSRDFRVYKGRRGRMRQLEIGDVTSDSEGGVFSIQNGNEQLVINNHRPQWVRGSQSQDLQPVPVRENYPLIFSELGIYQNKRFELPCDDY